jgi:pimeloyl-ACP methyl ester carboxylesterase
MALLHRLSMMMTRLYRLPIILCLVAACSEPAASTEGAPSPTPPPAPDAPVGTPAIRFFSERDGFASEVTSIVFTDQFHVRIEGMPAGAEVVLTTRSYSAYEMNRGYVSEVTFVADAEGRVDTGTSAPVRGSYQGVDPDGIVWSGAPTVLKEGLGPDRAAAFFEAKSGEIMVTGELARSITSADVTVTPVTTNGLLAELVMPAGVTDRVPVVAFGGSEGGISGGESYAARLASWGYPVLAVAYFGMKGVPADLAEVPLEYFAKAFAFLDQRPETRKGKVVVIGGSRGGELALLLGAMFPNVVGVIADTPSSFRWPAVSDNGTAAWTYEGSSLPYVPSSGFSVPTFIPAPGGKRAAVMRSVFEQDMAGAAPNDLEAARITVEQTKGPILMFGGSSDDLWPACDFIERAKTHLEETGHRAQYGDEGVCFEGAGHFLSGIGLSTTTSMWSTRPEQVYSLGGTAAANAHAGRERDRKVRAFLERAAK